MKTRWYSENRESFKLPSLFQVKSDQNTKNYVCINGKARSEGYVATCSKLFLSREAIYKKRKNLGLHDKKTVKEWLRVSISKINLNLTDFKYKQPYQTNCHYYKYRSLKRL